MELMVILVGVMGVLVGVMGVMGFFLLRRLSRKRTRDKTTPLHKAAERGHPDPVAALLKDGADPNAKDEYGRTPLHRAAREGRVATVTALLANGADRNAKDTHGCTPLQRAAKGGHTRAAALLE